MAYRIYPNGTIETDNLEELLALLAHLDPTHPAVRDRGRNFGSLHRRRRERAATTLPDNTPKALPAKAMDNARG